MIFGLVFALALLVVGHDSGAQQGSADAIAVRVIPNPNHYSISRWYADQGFTGSPQALTVDGYDAIRDGRTVYVAAANIDPTSHLIYTNIYLISYDQNSSAPTVDILGQMIANWKFNDNITESSTPAPSCSISSLNCASDTDCGSGQTCALAGPAAGSCVLNATQNCAADTDCPTNFFCDSLKAKVTRDVKRVGRLEEMQEALANFQQVNHRYPNLAAGTYLPGNTLSVWPSWSQVLLSDLAVSQSAVDPINKIGKCSSDAAVKDGGDYSQSTPQNACSLDSGTTTGSCSNFSWDYDFTVPASSYRLWVETTNANSGGAYGDLSTFNPAVGAENTCPAPGVQHHLLFYVDGISKGTACNPAVNPDQPRQTAYADLGELTAGTHKVTVKWDNDWTYDPDGIPGNADGADSNLRIYRLGLTLTDDFDLKTCWDQNTKKFAYGSASAGSPLTLPAASYVFAYASNANGSQYQLCATLESRDPSLGYHFYPFDLANSACVAAAGVTAGGQAGVAAPQIVSQSLVGQPSQAFNGFIQVTDASGKPLQWSITNPAPSSWNTWAQAPVLVDTSNPYQKKVYASAAGAAGVYNLGLTIDDGQGGTLSTTTPITILSSAIAVSADDASYVLDPAVPFNYTLSFSSASLSNPSGSYSVTKISGPYDVLASVSKNFTALGDGTYQVQYGGVIPAAAKFTSDTPLHYRLAVTDKYGKTATKDFTITLQITPPAMSFSCGATARLNQYYSCDFGPPVQGSHTITYAVSGLPSGLSFVPAGTPSTNCSATQCAPPSVDNVISGSAAAAGSSHVTVTATNEYGATASQAFTLTINSFCGDGVKQAPNTEGRGGLYNDGYEDCDGLSGVTASVAASSISSQYACSSGANTPSPILTNDQCVYKSPVNGGGYCGDGYCQAVVSGQPRENCWNCPTDCGECAATISVAAQQEAVAYFNGQRLYQTAWPNQGVATRTLVRGNNVFGFWTHVASGAAGLAYRILVGPATAPYDVLDTTNSYLDCAATSSPSNWLAPTGYDPSGELTNNNYKWTETGFSETAAFQASQLLRPSTNAVISSPLAQVNIPGKAVDASILPYVWGTNPASTPSAFYCRLNYNYDLSHLGVGRPRCQDQYCGPDGNGGFCNNTCPYAAQSACNAGTAYNCICTPVCAGKCAGEADGCGSTCPDTGNNHACVYNGQVTKTQTCNIALGYPQGGFTGNANCNSTCSGYDTTACQVDMSYWYSAPNDTVAYVGRECMVKMNVDANNNLQCDNTNQISLNANAQWFRGAIVQTGSTNCNPAANAISCAANYTDASGTAKTCNPGSAINNEKCRWLSNCVTPWTGSCYVHN